MYVPASILGADAVQRSSQSTTDHGVEVIFSSLALSPTKNECRRNSWAEDFGSSPRRSAGSRT